MRKWNQTVFNKSSEERLEFEKSLKNESFDKVSKRLKPKRIEEKKEKIHEVDAELEEEEVFEASFSKTSSISIKELQNEESAKEQIERAIQREKAMEKEELRKEMNEQDLVKDLIKEKLGFMWKFWRY